MAGLGRIGQVLHRVHKTRQWTPLTLSSRSKGYTNKDWQPGPYPETEAERRAAAKKYNMVYEDYEPYDKEDMNMMDFPLGDYPKLQPFGEWSRDPFADYEIPAWKRMYGEPVHMHYAAYIAPRHDISAILPVTPRRQFLNVFGMLFLWFALFGICEVYDIRANMVEVPAKKQYPQEGVVHYTFEPAD